MAELGDEADAITDEIGDARSRSSVDVLVAVGERARLYMAPGVTEMHWVADLRSLEQADGIGGVFRPGDAILVKASRAVGLEGIPAPIEKLAGAWSES